MNLEIDNETLDNLCSLINADQRNIHITICDLTLNSIHLHGLELSSVSIEKSEVPNITINELKINDSFKLTSIKAQTIKIRQTTFRGYTEFSKIEANSFYINFNLFKEIVFFNDLNCTDLLDIYDNRILLLPSFQVKCDQIESYTINTLRLMKETYERRYDKISANKFHALELARKREKINQNALNLLKNLKRKKCANNDDTSVLNKNTLGDWLIFNFHGITSNHSQSWFLPLYWVIIFGLFGSTFIVGNEQLNSFLLTVLSLTGVLFFAYLDVQKNIIKGTPHFILLVFLSAFYFIKYGFDLSYLGTYLEHSYKIFDYAGESTISGFHYVINKAIIAYLTYQFILGVRKDTRR